jgi:hypothetical protein
MSPNWYRDLRVLRWKVSAVKCSDTLAPSALLRYVMLQGFGDVSVACGVRVSPSWLENINSDGGAGSEGL